MRTNHYLAAAAAATAVSAAATTHPAGAAAAAAAAAKSAAATASLKDIKHVVLFMQENRAFDHVSPFLVSSVPICQ